jgi:hypothetical protein
MIKIMKKLKISNHLKIINIIILIKIILLFKHLLINRLNLNLKVHFVILFLLLDAPLNKFLLKIIGNVFKYLLWPFKLVIIPPSNRHPLLIFSVKLFKNNL